MSKLFVCIEKVRDVYAGAFNKHDELNCTDCKNKIPCQYVGEGGEWVKLGYFSIEPGMIFNDFYYNHEDSIRIMQNAQHHFFTYDITKKTFDECFQVPRFRIKFLIQYGSLTHGLQPVNEAAKLIMGAYHNLVAKQQ